jgi:hypothetical protein
VQQICSRTSQNTYIQEMIKSSTGIVEEESKRTEKMMDSISVRQKKNKRETTTTVAVMVKITKKRKSHMKSKIASIYSFNSKLSTKTTQSVRERP